MIKLFPANSESSVVTFTIENFLGALIIRFCSSGSLSKALIISHLTCG